MDALVDKLVQVGVLKSERLIRVFRAVDRKDFVPSEYRSEAYGDYPLPIAAGQTISQPYTVAFMLELLGSREGERILDVGSGSGWTTALLAEVVGVKGHVWGVEVVLELAAMGRANLEKYAFKHAEILPAGREIGLPEKAPFDRILVSAAAGDLPQPLVEQLKVGGVMVVPVRDAVWRVEKMSETETKIDKHEGFAFVPLV